MKKFYCILSNVFARGGILVFFIMAFEVMIMISPFAFFFYSVFNPIFKYLNNYAVTKWLTTFFLPHMILPPTLFLKIIRIIGSGLFIAGFFIFVICALQVYLGKIFKLGIADKGLYKYIRHPQYLALGIWGIAMSILWPRFIILVTLSIMFILYYFLAKDEERRMIQLYGNSYKQYMENTGMFFAVFVKKRFNINTIIKIPLNNLIISLLIITTVIGTGFILRGITLHSLPFKSKNNISLISILPEDNNHNSNILNCIFKNQVKGRMFFLKNDKDYLGYTMPPDYIMQGMIANTGGEFHLFKKHNTLAMITDWVLSPFEHLRRPPSAHMAKMHNVDPSFTRRHHCPIKINKPSLNCESCPYRRVIVVEVNHDNNIHLSGKNLLSFNTTRTPVFFFDINTITGEIINQTKVKKTTAWKNVPTPAI